MDKMNNILEVSPKVELAVGGVEVIDAISNRFKNLIPESEDLDREEVLTAQKSCSEFIEQMSEMKKSIENSDGGESRELLNGWKLGRMHSEKPRERIESWVADFAASILTAEQMRQNPDMANQLFVSGSNFSIEQAKRGNFITLDVISGVNKEGMNYIYKILGVDPDQLIKSGDPILGKYFTEIFGEQLKEQTHKANLESAEDYELRIKSKVDLHKKEYFSNTNVYPTEIPGLILTKMNDRMGQGSAYNFSAIYVFADSRQNVKME